MRNLVILVVVVAGLWSVWWYTGASGKEMAIRAWLAQQRQAGWVAEYERLDVVGYPSRFDTTVTGLAIADPRSGWAWTAPTFQILAQAYSPNHIIAVWPGAQRLGTPFETVTADAARMRGSVVFEPNTQLALDRTAIEIDALTLSGATGWEATLERGFLATRQAGADTAPPFAHDVSLEALALTPPAPLKRLFDPAGILPGVMEEARLDMTPVFDAAWNRRAVETGALPALTALNLRDLTVRWGELELTARGELAVDRRGFPEGTLDVTARNWRDMLRLAVQSGMLRADLADQAETALGFLARLSGERGTLKVPLGFSGGFVRLGPVPIGPAPRLR